MTKGLKKSNPKGDVEKKPKIVKKAKSAEGTVKKQAAAKGLPKGQGIKRAHTDRKYFTVGEDSQILESVVSGGVVSAVAKRLAGPLSRSAEAIRDRVKRYLNKIPANEKIQIHQHAKKNPKHYVHFKKDGENKKIEKIIATQPSLQNRELFRRPRVSKKPKDIKLKKVVTPDEKFKWVTEKLQNKDSYFKLEFSVQLLADIFSVLIEQEGVPLHEIQNYVTGVHCDQSLNHILEHFKLKNK